jgi:hypothetical protein
MKLRIRKAVHFYETPVVSSVYYTFSIQKYIYLGIQF